jgi:hypothetical protein
MTLHRERLRDRRRRDRYVAPAMGTVVGWRSVLGSFDAFDVSMKYLPVFH